MQAYHMTAVGRDKRGDLVDLRCFVVARTEEDAFLLAPGTDQFVIDEGPHVARRAKMLGLHGPGVVRDETHIQGSLPRAA